MHNPITRLYDMHVISGGQTGVDLAGLRAAQCLGIKTGGLAPKGWKTTAGPKSQLKTTFRLEEGVGGYTDRTRKNVERAHVTFILARDFDSSGTKLTIACAEASERPVYKFQLPDPNRVELKHADLDAAATFIKEQAMLVPEGESFILNIAGNSSRTCKGIFFPAFIALAEIFTRLAQQIDVIEAEHSVHFRQKLMDDPRMIHALNDNFDYFGELDPRGLRGLII